MAITILTPVQLGGQLADVFDSYLFGLSSLQQVALPKLSAATLVTLPQEDVAYQGELLYYLTATSNSLHQLARHLQDASYELEVFAEDFGADLEAYAHYAWQQTQKPPARTKAARKPPKSVDLTPYQLHAVLAPCFAGFPGYQERIGTSTSADFAFTSSLLSNELTHGLRDPSRPAVPSNLTTHTPADRLAVGLPATKLGKRWVGCNVSLQGPDLVAAFDLALTRGQQAAAHYRSLAPDDAVGFRQLYHLVQAIMHTTCQIS